MPRRGRRHHLHAARCTLHSSTTAACRPALGIGPRGSDPERDPPVPSDEARGPETGRTEPQPRARLFTRTPNLSAHDHPRPVGGVCPGSRFAGCTDSIAPRACIAPSNVSGQRDGVSLFNIRPYSIRTPSLPLCYPNQANGLDLFPNEYVVSPLHKEQNAVLRRDLGLREAPTVQVVGHSVTAPSQARSRRNLVDLASPDARETASCTGLP